MVLLLQQCSLILYIGRVNNTITKDIGEAMFGVNLLLVMLFQEKDSVDGKVGINYSLIPVVMNNGYMFLSNLLQLSMSDDGKNQIRVNRSMVGKSVFWFAASVAGYLMMARYNQGLNLQSSTEMFVFSVFETVFMVATALNFFYSWQTYASASEPGSTPEVIEVPLRSVSSYFLADLKSILGLVCECRPLSIFFDSMQPGLGRLERLTGRGGNMAPF